MALSPKEREKIIEEETLRFETRRNLHKKACAGRPVRWPWILIGILLVYGLWAHIFCGSGSERCEWHSMAHQKCTGWMAPGPGETAPGQPVAPEKK